MLHTPFFARACMALIRLSRSDLARLQIQMVVVVVVVVVKQDTIEVLSRCE